MGGVNVTSSLLFFCGVSSIVLNVSFSQQVLYYLNNNMFVQQCRQDLRRVVKDSTAT